MKKNFPIVFIITIFIFSIYYSYKVLITINTNDFDLESTKNILFFNEVMNIDGAIKTKFETGYGIYTTDYNENISIIQNNNELIPEVMHYNNSTIKYSIDFNKELVKINRDLLYMQVPDKGFFFWEYLNDNNLSDGYKTYYKSLKLLTKNNINYIDTYDLLNKSGFTRNKIYYKTDSHWTLDSGLYLSNILADYLNDKYSFNLDKSCISKNKFYQEKIKNSYRGAYSIYKNSSLKDDFTYYFPTYDTDFTVTCNDKKQRGNIKKVIYNEMTNESNKFSTNFYYNGIIGGTEPYVKIINNKIDNDYKVLIIGNSFTKALTPFLSLMIKELDIIDIRSNVGNYHKNILNYVKENDIDLVILFSVINSEEEYQRLINGNK